MNSVNLSSWARLGIRGIQLERWLESVDYIAPDTVNTVRAQQDGSLIARLSPGELLWLTGDSETPEPHCDIQQDYRCYIVARRDSHCWFQLQGEDVADFMATVCGVNLDPTVFEPLQVAQTQVARISAIVIRHPGQEYRLSILTDQSYTGYLAEVLTENVG